MSDQQLREAFALMKEGKKQEAVQVVREILKADGKNDRAWWMMVQLLDDEEKKLKAAERVLQLNPSHAGALKMLKPEQAAEVGEKKKKRGDYDWSKLEKAERERANTSSSGDMVAGAAIWFGRRFLIRVAGIILFLIGTPIFLFIRDNLPVGEITGAPPEEVVIAQLTAAFNGDIETMRYLTCDSLEDEWESEYRGLQSQAEDAGIDGFQFDVSNMQTSVIEQSARRAVVELTGEIAVTAAGERVTIDIKELLVTGGGSEDDNKMSLIVQDSHWVVCST
jgi:hypothetical protein